MMNIRADDTGGRRSLVVVLAALLVATILVFVGAVAVSAGGEVPELQPGDALV